MSLAHSSVGSNDILLLSGNTKGHDKIVGDLHGNNMVLKKIIDTLSPNDRLFIVGDLTDRGAESLAVIQTVIKFQNENPERLHITRGNHESLCLGTIEALKNLFEKKIITDAKSIGSLILKGSDGKLKINPTIPRENPAISDLNRIISHYNNGGAWLVALFFKEVHDRKINQNDNGIDYAEDSQIKVIQEFMSKLPYIIHVTGVEPFNMVHADMPIGDEILKNKMENDDLTLSEKEKRHATWARASFTEKVKMKIPTYVGHNIILGDKHKSVRAESNTINLDAAAYKTNSLLVFDHTERRCDLVTAGDYINHPDLIEYQQPLNDEKDRINSFVSSNDEEKLEAINTRDVIRAIKNSPTITTPAASLQAISPLENPDNASISPQVEMKASEEKRKESGKQEQEAQPFKFKS